MLSSQVQEFLALPEAVAQWSLTSLREKLIKIGVKFVRHARYAVFQMAEAAMPGDLFRKMLLRIEGLRSSLWHRTERGKCVVTGWTGQKRRDNSAGRLRVHPNPTD